MWRRLVQLGLVNYDISQSLVGYQMHCSNLCDLVLRFLEIHLFLLLPDVVSSLLIDEWIFKSLLRIGGCESCPFKTNVKFPNMHGPSGVCGLRMPCQILACIGLSAKHFAVYGLVLGISSLKTTVVAIWQLHFMISTAKSGSAVYLLLPLDYFLNLFFASRAFYWIHNHVNELIVDLLTGREIFQIFAGWQILAPTLFSLFVCFAAGIKVIVDGMSLQSSFMKQAPFTKVEKYPRIVIHHPMATF